MMEERITQLEAKSDSNAAALAALETDMNDRFNRIETELSEEAAQRQFSQMDKQFGQVEWRFDQINLRFDQMDARFDHVEASIADLRKELHHFARWGLGFLAIITVAALSLVAKAFLG